MKPALASSVLLLTAVAARVWLRDDSWKILAPEAPALLAVFPAVYLLGRPWRFERAPEPAEPRPRLALATGLLLAGGALVGSTLALALGWVGLAALLLEWSGVRTAHPRPAALGALAAMGFPWLASDLAGLAWPFRTSCAAAAAGLLGAVGCPVEAAGPLIRLRGVVLSVDASCSGLGALQACLLLAAFACARPAGARRSPAALAGAACALAWSANVLRLVGLAALALAFGAPAARGEAHTATGLLALLGPALLLALFARPRVRRMPQVAA